MAAAKEDTKWLDPLSKEDDVRNDLVQALKVKTWDELLAKAGISAALKDHKQLAKLTIKPETLIKVVVAGRARPKDEDPVFDPDLLAAKIDAIRQEFLAYLTFTHPSLRSKPAPKGFEYPSVSVDSDRFLSLLADLFEAYKTQYTEQKAAKEFVKAHRKQFVLFVGKHWIKNGLRLYANDKKGEMKLQQFDAKDEAEQDQYCAELVTTLRNAKAHGHVLYHNLSSEDYFEAYGLAVPAVVGAQEANNTTIYPFNLHPETRKRITRVVATQVSELRYWLYTLLHAILRPEIPEFKCVLGCNTYKRAA